ncbi:uncharacterized protein B0H64DRAFT_129834 [Chaetomium fimeti]|uniref:DUF2293 domain-containing protein n=1 Tax=Chaetomium fimeti TaxID=1854472 RepID=A0AAE0HJN7_9PEZI|nr:hypothetical protein B0H64DRAFT_129834 [Chaetomium fimeti]
MGREKKSAPGVGTGDHAKERHKRDRKGNLIDWTAPLPPGLVARPEQPRVSSKHKSWFEFIENKEKKKKLEFEFTEKREPPPGFEFVPIGNPALTTACKELSREQDAMIFIVTSMNGLSKRLSSHLNRVGHHIRQTIVEQARATLGDDQFEAIGAAPGLPEPIPERQEDINKQADAAIRDLFPRIPHTDRQTIIEHAFNKSRPTGKDGPPVGLAPDVTLSRRVQLAVLAHIRHNHTRYDQLLKETAYVNARKAVESLCLDILVKWRGDEETGRDQLDEILCEVIVISDSESDDSDSDDEDDSSTVSSSDESLVDRVMRDDVPARAELPAVGPSPAPLTTNSSRNEGLRAIHAPQRVKKPSRKDKKAVKWGQRGFQRYQAARDQAWHQAVERQRLDNDGPMTTTGPRAADRPASHGPQPWRAGEPGRADPGAGTRSPVESAYHAHDPYGSSLPPVNVPHKPGNQIDEPRRTIPTATYHIPQQIRTQVHTSSSGFRPIVGSWAAPDGAPELERVDHHGQDLKDYVLPSIEPASPGAPSLPPRFPVSYRQPKPGLSYAGQSSISRTTHRPAGTAGAVAAAEDDRTDFPKEGFIKLPPRSGPSRMPPVPDQHREPFILLNPQRASAGNSGAIATSSGLGSRHSSIRWDGAATRDDLDLRPGRRPVWIGHDGAILRSESRPIIIQDYGPPPREPPPMEPAYVSSDNRRPSPTTRADVRHLGRGWLDDRDRLYGDSGIDQRIESLPGDFVEIVRVSNKFPRQHEPRPTPVEASRFGQRPAAQQQGNPQQQFVDGVARYDARQPPGPGQRIERVVGRVEIPAFHNENVPFAAQQLQGYPRQERMVGIEYARPHPSLEARTQAGGGPFYDVGDPIYRSRSHSVVAPPYPGLPYQPHAGRPTPRRDEVITLD